MARLKIMSLNGEDMVDLVPRSLKIPGKESPHYWRARLLAAMIREINPDIIGLVEAPPTQARTEKFVDYYLDGKYRACQGEKRGLLGFAFLLRRNLKVKINKRSKQQSLNDFKLDKFDADRDSIKEYYSWRNRVPLEVTVSGGGLKDKATFILVHAKSKGVFIPGDLFAYEKLSQANRMKQRAQADAIRRRLDRLINDNRRGRCVVMGDMNDGPEFDKYAAMLGRGFLEPMMGNIWQPNKVMHNPHYCLNKKVRWTIDFMDRILNPLAESRYGQPKEMRSWIDHILLSPELRNSVVKGSVGILHRRPSVKGLPGKFAGMKPTDHHPPYLTLDL